MKLKSLLFGSAAAVMVASGAQAADPIIVAEPVNYVRICDAFGAGFFYIPGSNTCLKISGYARAEASWVQEGNDEPETYFTTATADVGALFPFPPGFAGVNTFIDSIDIGVTSNPADPNILGGPLGASATIGGMTVGGVQVSADAFDNFTTRARGEVQFDARTETDMGILRSYVALRGTIGHNSTSDDFSIDKAFLTLQNDFGTFTAGHILSFFDFFGGYSLNSRVGGDDPTSTVNLFGYTFNAGNGFSASISIEDRRQRQNDLDLYPVYNVPSHLVSILQQSTPFGPSPTCPGGIFGIGGCLNQINGSVTYLAGAEYDGQEVPDFVANIRVDQGWGSAQIMGGLRQVNTRYGGDAVIRSSDITRLIPPIPGGIADDIADIANLFVPPYPGFADDKLGWVVGAGLTVDIPGTGVEASVQGAYTEGMTGYVTTGNGAVLTDALSVGTVTWVNGVPSVTGYDQDLTKAWSIIAGIKADLTQTVEVRLNGTYADVDHAGAYFDYDTWTVAGTVLWRPVEGLSIGGEISYERVDGDVYAAGDAIAGILPTPVGIGDGDLWGALFRVTRSF